MDDKTLSRQLNRPGAPAPLATRLRKNWQEQIAAPKPSLIRPRPMMLGASGLLLVLLAVVALFRLQAPPQLVTLALGDIAADARRDIKIAIPFESLLRELGINTPAQGMPVTMAKYCTLNNTRTTHLIIAAGHQAEVHLFIRKGGFDIPAWQARDGRESGMFWKLINPRENVSVLVFRNENMNQEKVDQLLKHMFYA